MEESQRSIIPEKQVFKPKVDYMSAIFEIIKDRCSYNEGKVEDLEVIERRVTSRGYNSEEFKITLKNYENLNVIMIEDGSSVRLLIWGMVKIEK